MTSRPLPTNKPIALHAATASSPVASRALSCSVASSPMRSRRRRRARAIFGRSEPERRYAGFSSVADMPPTIRGREERSGGHGGRARGRRRLGTGDPTEDPRALGHERRAEPVDLREGFGDGRDYRRDDGGPERENEHLGDDRDRDDVRGDGDERDLVELEPRHRRGRKPTRGRDPNELCDAAWHGIAVEKPHHPRGDDEDRRHRREGELEAGVEDEHRVPREQDERTNEEGVPAIALTRREPRERTEGRSDRGTHHRRMKADCERIRADRGEGGDLG